ncbi:hypothetical protein B0G71_8136 [Paraburkholderia sp. BL27I4N3]|uniref:hypothetical protein n=1 Tax=Paraburkholderia sp. BL27I4N3 TaxID=1938805 RepID=UPI000E3677F9|nr:hypothetical protein [Paraburkholderia sp. BL27I4N3]REE07601.1 hypothetical protein B0G71_8136 [Paraburkholderia sp. BL27I4N3]
MTTSQAYTSTAPALHVFEQAGGWHWGITVPRAKGSGFKLIAFSECTFPVEDAARADGELALIHLTDSDPASDSPSGPRGKEVCRSAMRKLKSTPIGQEVTAMSQPNTNLTVPLLTVDSTLWFSAYGFGWGYCAFALPAETVCEKLGAANGTAKQLMLAFELGKRKILQVVEQKAIPSTGERITLSAADL